MIKKLNTEYVSIVILTLSVLNFFLAGCRNTEQSKSVEEREGKWERASAQPSIIQSSLQENRLVDFSLLIKDKPEETIVGKEIIGGNLQFDNGSLTIINAGLKLPEDCCIEFLGPSGSIELERASLKTAGLINADVEAGRGSELHLYGDDPLKSSKIDMRGTDITLYFYSLSVEYVISNILNEDMVSIEGQKIAIPEGKDELKTASYKLKVSGFKKGTRVTLHLLHSALSLQ
ncbi:MAG: hypothetical protein ABFS32_04140 [Bacteroidota bacterium]